MHTPLRLLGLALLLGSLARADLEFVGILATRDKTRFALTDTATEKTAWLALGETFSEHKLAAYDRATDTLTLVKDGAETRVRLKDDAKIKSSRLELTGTITLGGEEKVEIERATLLFDQENVFPLKDGVVYRITPARRDDGTIFYAIVIERTLAPNRTERISAPGIVTLPGHPFWLKVGDSGFSFTPR